MPQGRSLRLASFDGGGPRAFSQLVIMKRFMHQVGGCENQGKTLLPCDWFDMIGGSDTGGLIAIMFVKLRMSVEEVMHEFSKVMDQVYAKGLEPVERTRRMRICIEELLEEKGFTPDLRLEPDRRLEEPKQERNCVGFVVSITRQCVSNKVCFRTYFDPIDPPSDIRVVEAIMATCASPAEFLPVEIGIKPENCEYVGASVGANNPIRHVINEAHTYFGQASKVRVILSLGSGHPGVLAFDHREANGLRTLLLQMMHGFEWEDLDFRQMEQKRIYFRFSVVQGLQNDEALAESVEWISAQTHAYIRTHGPAKTLKKCVRQAKRGCARVSLKHLNPTWGLHHGTPSEESSSRSTSGDDVLPGPNPTQVAPERSPETVGARLSDQTRHNYTLRGVVAVSNPAIYRTASGDDVSLSDAGSSLGSRIHRSDLENDAQDIESPTEGPVENSLGPVHAGVSQGVRLQQALDQTRCLSRTYSKSVERAYILSFEPSTQSQFSDAGTVSGLRPQGVQLERSDSGPQKSAPRTKHLNSGNKPYGVDTISCKPGPAPEDVPTVSACDLLSTQFAQRRMPYRSRSFPVQATSTRKRPAPKLRGSPTPRLGHQPKRFFSLDSSHLQVAKINALLEEDPTTARAKVVEDIKPAEKQPLTDGAQSKQLEEEQLPAYSLTFNELQVTEKRVTTAARAAEQARIDEKKRSKKINKTMQQVLFRALQHVPIAGRHGRLPTATIDKLLRSALPAALLSQISSEIPILGENRSAVAAALGLGILTAQGAILGAA